MNRVPLTRPLLSTLTRLRRGLAARVKSRCTYIDVERSSGRVAIYFPPIKLHRGHKGFEPFDLQIHTDDACVVFDKSELPTAVLKILGVPAD